MSLKGWIEANNYKGGIIRYLYDVMVNMDSGDSTVAGKVTALETTVGDSSSGLVKDMTDAKAAIGTDDTTAGGLKKRCKTIETAIGDNTTGEETGIYKDIADLVAAIGDEDTSGTILYRIKQLEDG